MRSFGEGQAIAAFEHARELDPKSSFPDFGLGQVYLAQGDYDKALAALSKSFHPTANDYFWTGAAYAARGDKEKALTMLQKAFDAGFRDFAALDASPYFSALRPNPRFQHLTELTASNARSALALGDRSEIAQMVSINRQHRSISYDGRSEVFGRPSDW